MAIDGSTNPRRSPCSKMAAIISVLVGVSDTIGRRRLTAQTSAVHFVVQRVRRSRLHNRGIHRGIQAFPQPGIQREPDAGWLGACRQGIVRRCPIGASVCASSSLRVHLAARPYCSIVRLGVCGGRGPEVPELLIPGVEHLAHPDELGPQADQLLPARAPQSLGRSVRHP